MLAVLQIYSTAQQELLLLHSTICSSHPIRLLQQVGDVRLSSGPVGFKKKRKKSGTSSFIFVHVKYLSGVAVTKLSVYTQSLNNKTTKDKVDPASMPDLLEHKHTGTHSVFPLIWSIAPRKSDFPSSRPSSSPDTPPKVEIWFKIGYGCPLHQH